MPGSSCSFPVALSAAQRAAQIPRMAAAHLCPAHPGRASHSPEPLQTVAHEADTIFTLFRLSIGASYQVSKWSVRMRVRGHAQARAVRRWGRGHLTATELLPFHGPVD